jgi:hypothetical protein
MLFKFLSFNFELTNSAKAFVDKTNSLCDALRYMRLFRSFLESKRFANSVRTLSLDRPRHHLFHPARRILDRQRKFGSAAFQPDSE